MKTSTFAALASIGAGAYFFTQCKLIQTTSYDIYNSNIPKSFDGFKIIHLSDLHNCYFGPMSNNYLIKKINNINPDLIVVSGDFFDDEKYDNSKKILRHLAQKYKIIFTPGGHEYWTPEYELIKKELHSYNVDFLEDKRVEVEIEDESIYITGLLDPTFYQDDIEILEKNLKKYQSDKKFHILLTHRPDLFKKYTNKKYDLVLTGHAHGGQIRFANQGMYAPNQGFFPKYTAGIHTRKNRNMIVNRGIGWHSSFVKINNRPEIVTCILHSESN